MAKRKTDAAAAGAGTECIRVRGARQNNLKGFDVDIPLGRFTVVTGLSGSGKSSLVFDTVYAEGQRRYIETFSSYARQFLDRLPPPAVDAVEGIPPAIAIRQTNSIRNSRSTVGTMTELNDRFKLLFANCARLFCPDCGREIVPASPDSVFDDLLARGLEGSRSIVAFEVDVPASVSREDALALLASQGFARVRECGGVSPCEAPPHSHDSPEPVGRPRKNQPPNHVAARRFRVDLDMLRVDPAKRARFCEGLETAFARGRGAALVVPLGEDRAEGDPLRFSARLECPDCGRAFEEARPNLFSFNSPIGACPACKGFGRVIGVSEALVVPEPGKSIAAGCVKPFQTKSFIDGQRLLVRRAKEVGCPTDVPWEKLPAKWRKWVWDGETDDWESGLWPGVAEFFRWLEGRAYKLHVRVMLSRYREYATCRECGGARLRPAALAWKLVAGGEKHDAASLAALTVLEARAFLEAFSREHPAGTSAGDGAQALLAGVLPRLRYLEEVGVGYLALDRQSRTLSGGEAQRIALTTALGSDLTGTLFVLDEPSVGLHPRDIARLVAILRRLRDAGNTVLVVEHDPAVILAADHVVELGPGPGERGGEVVYRGDVPGLLRCKASVSAPWLRPTRMSKPRTAGAETAPAAAAPAMKAPSGRASRGGKTSANSETGPVLRLLGASEHNLKNVDVEFPLGKIVAVTGVSGSGKSTLVSDVLHPAVRRALGLPAPDCGAFRRLEGADAFGGVELVDQSPIGKSARSTPASYLGAFDEIRHVFAETPAAKARGVALADFSFNYGLGRCPDCEGSGFEHVEMQFLSDVYLPCETCGGRRYRPEVLAVTVPDERDGRELSIADVLDLTVDEAMAAFARRKAVAKALQPLVDVGLGYLRMGQPVPTLSGGEAQRLKLAEFLAKLPAASAARGVRGAKPPVRCKPSLLLFDEPTTGLHFADVDVLLGVFRRLRDEGHTLVVIEHNLQVLRACDWIVDLGPEGGEDGGRVVATGTPADLAAHGVGPTSDALRGAF
ncbi:MAG: excinuclease ABC subunit UvrA [Kiritimatiellae bacterium]|nr:excinuclease ABC subunit UvrA [Kiritimatiellia bacterium]